MRNMLILLRASTRMRVKTRTVKGILLAVCCFLVTSVAQASGDGIHLDKANINPADKLSLQRGAKLFVDYCLGCHSLSFLRYNRLAKDLSISESDTFDQLIFTGAKFGDQIHNAMNANDARRWFGTPPPDLSVIARSRSVDWIYTYLRSFYRDPNRPWGVNNTVYKDVAMPHVLWELQGLQDRVESPQPNKSLQPNKSPQQDKVNHPSGNNSEAVRQTKLTLIEKGKQTTQQFDSSVRDIVNFLHYVAEPSKIQRLQLGKWVLGFLFVLFIVVYLLKKEYWKDIH